MRDHLLSRHPWCVICRRMGRLTRATVVDHIRPHKGDPRLFFDYDNLQPLCASCHAALKQREEIAGYSDAVDEETGRPIDGRHPWYDRR